MTRRTNRKINRKSKTTSTTVSHPAHQDEGETVFDLKDQKASSLEDAMGEIRWTSTKTYEESDLFVETQEIPVFEENEKSIKQKSIDASKLQFQGMVNKFEEAMKLFEETKKGLEYLFDDLVPDCGETMETEMKKNLTNFNEVIKMVVSETGSYKTVVSINDLCQDEIDIEIESDGFDYHSDASDECENEMNNSDYVWTDEEIDVKRVEKPSLPISYEDPQSYLNSPISIVKEKRLIDYESYDRDFESDNGYQYQSRSRYSTEYCENDSSDITSEEENEEHEQKQEAVSQDHINVIGRQESDEFKIVVKDIEDLNEVVEIQIVIEYKTNVKKNYNGVLAVMLIENASEIKLNKNGMNIKAGEEYSKVSVSQHIQKNWKKRKKNLYIVDIRAYHSHRNRSLTSDRKRLDEVRRRARYKQHE